MIEREIVRRVEANTGRKSGRWEVNVHIYATTNNPAGAGGGASNGVVAGAGGDSATGGKPSPAQQQQQQRRVVETISLSDVPEKLYLVLGGGMGTSAVPRPSTTTTTAATTYGHMCEVEPAMLPLMAKISPLRQRARRFVKGDEYDFEDFCVRVGVSFDRHNSPAGVVVEIEYRPCAYVHECHAVIAELMERIAAPLVPPPLPSADPVVSAAANKQYVYKAVKLDDKKIRKSDLAPFSNRTTAWLYCTHLGTLGN